MFKTSTRYFVLALTLIALTATTRPAHAQSDDPCTDPTTGCVVGGGDPQPTGKVVTTTAPQTVADGNSTSDSQSLDDLIPYLMILYGLA